MAGEAARAESLAKDLDQRYPLDTQMQSLWLPAIRAQLAVHRQNADAAVNDLQRALPHIEHGQIGFVNNLSCLYPAYIRGQAYLAVGQGREAVLEFQKILDHSGIVWNCWTGALARLQLGRAEAMMGDKAAARKSYQDFLILWKDADPDIPIYKQAKAEYAKLR
jgi:eukaryotic-like serine/threonine-protein kinase